MEDKAILTPEEVGEMLRVSKFTVVRLASKRKLPGKKVGGQWRFVKEAVEKWVEEERGEV